MNIRLPFTDRRSPRQSYPYGAPWLKQQLERAKKRQYFGDREEKKDSTCPAQSENKGLV